MSKLQTLILELAATGLSNQEVADEVRRRMPNAKTSAASVASVKSRAKKDGQNFVAPAAVTTVLPIVTNDTPQAIMTAKINEVIEQAVALYNLPSLRSTKIRFDLRGRAAGQARYRRNRVSGEIFDLELRINMEAYKLAPEDTLNETIPHEVAHLVAEHDGRHSHDAYWKRIARSLGCSGERCHTLNLKPANGGYKYVVSGREVIVGAGVHKKIQAGGVRILKATRERFGRENYVGRA